MKLKKINAALMSRVERSMDQQLNAFSLFETDHCARPQGSRPDSSAARGAAFGRARQ
ncbi:hypothetical protein ACVJF1_003564 [Bradyrhizobium diazoefficiens]